MSCEPGRLVLVSSESVRLTLDVISRGSPGQLANGQPTDNASLRAGDACLDPAGQSTHVTKAFVPPRWRVAATDGPMFDPQMGADIEHLIGLHDVGDQQPSRNRWTCVGARATQASSPALTPSEGMSSTVISIVDDAALVCWIGYLHGP